MLSLLVANREVYSLPTTGKESVWRPPKPVDNHKHILGLV